MSQSSLRQAVLEQVAEPRIDVRPIPQDELVKEWGTLGPYIENAASATWGRYTAKDIVSGVARGDMRAVAVVDWSGPELLAVAIVQRWQAPSGKIVGEVSFIGALKELPLPPGAWKAAWDKMVRIFVDVGCDQVQVIGRAGWGRALGLAPTAHHFVVEIRRKE